jgi:hypothetical protein
MDRNEEQRRTFALIWPLAMVLAVLALPLYLIGIITLTNAIVSLIAASLLALFSYRRSRRVPPGEPPVRGGSESV